MSASIPSFSCWRTTRWPRPARQRRRSCGGAYRGPNARHTLRAQGPVRHGRDTHNLRLPGGHRPRAHRGCHHHRAVEASRRHPARQAGNARVCPGRPGLDNPLRAGVQSLEPGPHYRRVQQRFRLSGGVGTGYGRPGVLHRRGPSAARPRCAASLVSSPPTGA